MCFSKINEKTQVGLYNYETVRDEKEESAKIEHEKTESNHPICKKKITNKSKNDEIYNKLKKKAFQIIFHLLDKNNTGIISKNSICVTSPNNIDLPNVIFNIYKEYLNLIEISNIQVTLEEFICNSSKIFNNLSSLERNKILEVDKLLDKEKYQAGLKKKLISKSIYKNH